MPRPKGAVNWKTREAQRYSLRIIEDEAYLANLLERARNGTLGVMEPVLWAYGFGRPKESIDVTVGPRGELSGLSMDELVERLRDTLKELEEAKAINDALPPEYKVLAIGEEDK